MTPNDSKVYKNVNDSKELKSDLLNPHLLKAHVQLYQEKLCPSPMGIQQHIQHIWKQTFCKT